MTVSTRGLYFEPACLVTGRAFYFMDVSLSSSDTGGNTCRGRGLCAGVECLLCRCSISLENHVQCERFQLPVERSHFPFQRFVSFFERFAVNCVVALRLQFKPTALTNAGIRRREISRSDILAQVVHRNHQLDVALVKVEVDCGMAVFAVLFGRSASAEQSLLRVTLLWSFSSRLATPRPCQLRAAGFSEKLFE